VPRPIAFVSTVGADGVFNVAPFSLFTVLSAKPPMICFGIGRKRDGQKKYIPPVDKFGKWAL